MITISVKQPWAYLLCAGIKGIENRTWKLPEKYKGQKVLIHASAKTDKEPYMLFDDAQIDAIGNDIMDVVASYHNTSAIIGSIVFSDCVINHPSIWAEKTEVDCTNPIKCGSWNTDSCQDGCINHYGLKKPIYNWVCEDSILFDKPVLNVKGKLSFWDYPNIGCEQDEDGKDVCCCHLGIHEKDQVLSYGGGDYRCKYCGGKWHK
ncbi:ASCH domain-containing protein [Bacteroides graminisolvens]|uniref:Uncharacterized protein n=1 Tax=Bacteroides graminisolvens DSM 19988 = JCM 15093 TaxID=1121097 RepID=A0A069D582_9BACE|nr:ASCH domain-containing protein [Bacteroides graminisolvens]GAK37461.1 hypothetical protein JCM15093_2712 [Bacteroides graminisolvens DSM 19988 = JCM 15093]